jgi:hypothetical protein
MKTGRNSPCPCGSGRKYKQCCLLKQSGTSLGQKLMGGLLVVILAGGAVAALTSFIQSDSGTGPRRVWSEEHQHWHTLP